MKKLLMLLVLLLISGCSNSDIFIVNEGVIIPNSVCDNLDNNILIYQTGCSACALAIPRIDEVQKELNFEIKYVNLADPEQRVYLDEKQFTTLKVPTLIHNCNVYIGAKSTEEYREILKNA